MTPYDSLKYHKQTLQTGFLAVDPFTGEVKAWVGGVDFKTFKYDHVNINTKRNNARKKDAYQLVSINTGNNTSMLEIDFTRCFLKSIRKYITEGIITIPVILECD
jgi:hypothetical protein